jgi:hypothetical protein
MCAKIYRAIGAAQVGQREYRMNENFPAWKVELQPPAQRC